MTKFITVTNTKKKPKYSWGYCMTPWYIFTYKRGWKYVRPYTRKKLLIWAVFRHFQFWCHELSATWLWLWFVTCFFCVFPLNIVSVELYTRLLLLVFMLRFSILIIYNFHFLPISKWNENESNELKRFFIKVVALF